MSDKPFKELVASYKPILKAKDNGRHLCSLCGKDDRKGSLTAWIFSEDRCRCVASRDSSLQALRPEELDQANAEAPESVAALSSMPAETVISKDLGIDLGRRYEILEHVGSGAAGLVYKVLDKDLDSILAVKVLRPEAMQDSIMKQRFLQEAELAITLTHENLIGMYGHDKTPDGNLFLVMDYLEGRSLETILLHEAPLSEARFLNIFSQVLEGLAHAHLKGLIHRDLKPSNIFITQPSPGVEVVKLIDFGIAKLTQSALRTEHNLTQTGEVFGTPTYMSPEQCLGAAVDERSDIYSLGCVMYEAIKGTPPFSGDNPVQIILQHLKNEPVQLHCSYRIEQMIMRCLEKNAEDRPQSIQALTQVCRQIVTSKSPLPFAVSIDFELYRRKINGYLSFIHPAMRGAYALSAIMAGVGFLYAALTYIAVGKQPWQPVVFLRAGGLLIAGFGILANWEIFRLSKRMKTEQPRSGTLIQSAKGFLKSSILFRCDDKSFEVRTGYFGFRGRKVVEGETCKIWFFKDSKQLRPQAVSSKASGTSVLIKFSQTAILILLALCGLVVAQNLPATDPEKQIDNLAKAVAILSWLCPFLLALAGSHGIAELCRQRKWLAMTPRVASAATLCTLFSYLPSVLLYVFPGLSVLQPYCTYFADRTKLAPHPIEIMFYLFVWTWLTYWVISGAMMLMRRTVIIGRS